VATTTELDEVVEAEAVSGGGVGLLGVPLSGLVVTEPLPVPVGTGGVLGVDGVDGAVGDGRPQGDSEIA
jgi:hypothetical protein